MDQTQTKCSRAACPALAAVKLEWRNPKIHTDDRTKVWLSCEEHLSFLVEYLDSRGFYLGQEKIL
jgi:hypothetical protein